MLAFFVAVLQQSTYALEKCLLETLLECLKEVMEKTFC